jgi:hypothetical protein
LASFSRAEPANLGRAESERGRPRSAGARQRIQKRHRAWIATLVDAVTKTGKAFAKRDALPDHGLARRKARPLGSKVHFKFGRLRDRAQLGRG